MLGSLEPVHLKSRPQNGILQRAVLSTWRLPYPDIAFPVELP